MRWVRQLLSIVCTFDGEVVPFEIEGIPSGNTTLGHRFLSSKKIEVRRFEDYAQKLHKANVIVDADMRAPKPSAPKPRISPSRKASK